MLTVRSFLPPQPYNGTYGGVYNSPAPACPYTQPELTTGNWSEDCLFVDIYAPPNAQNLPVKAWLYGGSNAGGTISWRGFDSCNLASDSVVVLINYRVGPWGFLAIDSYGINGNQGIQDQLMALQWIQDNIAAFGGDPSKVVLFGQSAGALDSFIIGTLPQAPSLLNAGISESLAGQTFSNLSSASATGLKYAKKLNCDSLACLQNLTVQQTNTSVITDQLKGILIPGTANTGGFGPVVDGKVIPAIPVQAGSKVPWIFGTTTVEAAIFLALVGNPDIYTPTVYDTIVRAGYGSAGLAEYPLSDYNNTEWPGFYALTALSTDELFLCPTHNALNKAYEIGTPAWTYLWGQPSTCPPSDLESPRVAAVAGAAHGSEVEFVFANVYEPLDPGQNCSFTAAEQSLSKQFVAMWTSMAENGNPGAISWPQYDPNTNIGFIVKNGSSAAEPGVIDYSKCSYWNTQYANGTV